MRVLVIDGACDMHLLNRSMGTYNNKQAQYRERSERHARYGTKRTLWTAPLGTTLWSPLTQHTSRPHKALE